MLFSNLAATLVLFGGTLAAALPQTICTPAQTFCGDYGCVNTLDNVFNCGRCGVTCPRWHGADGYKCSGGKCVCMNEEYSCPNGDGTVRCVDKEVSMDDCGTCGNKCDPSSICASGQCICEVGMILCPDGKCAESCGCPDGQTECPNYGCISLLDNVFNCGACGVTCPRWHGIDGYKCSGGKCVCMNEEYSCPNGDGTVRCVDKQTSTDDCGTCGNKCDASATCSGGQCVCPAGETLCPDGKCAASCGCPDGKTECPNYGCISLLDNVFNCGACGVTCPRWHGIDGYKCSGGKCVCMNEEYSCPNGDGTVRCVDKQTSTDDCGTCGNKCDPSATCSGGQCVCPAGQALCSDGKCAASCISCPPKQNVCDGRCSNPTNDNQNCGACGVKCEVGANCVQGKCKGGPSGCPGNQLVCDGSCTNVKNDNRHCGACGVQCPVGQHCANGRCK